jgi:general secretion pathway protein L
VSVGTLAIRLHSAPQQIEWVQLDQQGRQYGAIRNDAHEDLRVLARDRRVIVLVPAMHVITTEVDIPPTKSSARMRQMLPFALEETLAQDVDELFFAVGPRRSSGKIAVAIVAEERMTCWLDELRALGITPAAIYAEFEGVPDTPGALTLIAEGRSVMGRLAGATPFFLEGLNLPQVIGLLDRGADKSGSSHLLLYADRTAYALHESTFPVLRDSSATFEARLLEGSSLPHLAATLVAQPGTNLLQGPHAPSSDWREALRPWRLAASLLLGLLLLTTATQAATYLNLQRQERDLASRVEQICREGFSSAQLAGCRAEVQRRLAAAGQGSVSSQQGFLATLQAIAEHRDPASAITALSFRNGVMDLRIVAPSVPALDEFVQRMGDSGLEARIQSVNPGEDGVESQLQVLGRGQ